MRKEFDCSELTNFIYQNADLNSNYTSIVTTHGAIETAYQYNDYLLINSDHLLTLYGNKLYWWQKIIIRLLRSKNKERKRYEELYKERIFRELK